MNKPTSFVFAVFFATAMSNNALATPPLNSCPAATEVDQRLRLVLEKPAQELASLSAMAIKNGQVVYQAQFGSRRIDANDVTKNQPANEKTLYRIASISKMVTAIGAMVLVEQGKLDLDRDASDYLGFTFRNPHFPKRVITTRMLLTHQSSLRDDAGYSFPFGQTLQSFLVPGAAHYGAGKQWSAKSPGLYFSYVNLNFGVIAAIMEKAGGERFDHLMHKLVLQPLKIRGAFNLNRLPAEDIKQLATLYRKQSNDVWNASGPWVAQVDDLQGKIPTPREELRGYELGSNPTLFSPQGGLRISVGGLGRLMRMLIGKGSLDGVQLLQPSSVTALLHEHWRYDEDAKNGDTEQGLFQAWSLGLQHFIGKAGKQNGDYLGALDGAPFTGFGHLGFAYGLESGFVFDPETGNGVIYAHGGSAADPEKNRGDQSSLSIWEEHIVGALLTCLRSTP